MSQYSDMQMLAICITNAIAGMIAARIMFGKKVVVREVEVPVEVVRPCDAPCCAPADSVPLQPPPIADVLADVYDDETHCTVEQMRQLVQPD